MSVVVINSFCGNCVYYVLKCGVEHLLCFFEYTFPLILIVIGILTTLYLTNKNDFRNQLKEIKRHKGKIVLTIFLSVLFPLLIMLLIYAATSIAKIFS